MVYNIWGGPRTASTYILYCLKIALKLKYGSVEIHQELFNNKNGKISPPDRLPLYDSCSKDSLPHVFKLFFKQIPPVSNRENNDFMSLVARLYNTPNTFNILLYREDILDTLLSYILMHVEGTRQTRDPNFYNSTAKIVPTEEIIQNRITNLVESIRRTTIAQSTYTFDAVIKYEDIKGIPTLDFPNYIPEDLAETNQDVNAHPLKLNSLEYKKSILPYREIEQRLHEALDQANLPHTLSFDTISPSSIIL